MRFYFRAVIAGIVAGAALFFFPFVFRFIFFALFAGFIIRLVTGRGRYGRRWRQGYDYRGEHLRQNEWPAEESIPIDGRQPSYPLLQATSPAQRFPVQ